MRVKERKAKGEGEDVDVVYLAEMSNIRSDRRLPFSLLFYIR